MRIKLGTDSDTMALIIRALVDAGLAPDEVHLADSRAGWFAEYHGLEDKPTHPTTAAPEVSGVITADEPTAELSPAAGLLAVAEWRAINKVASILCSQEWSLSTLDRVADVIREVRTGIPNALQGPEPPGWAGCWAESCRWTGSVKDVKPYDAAMAAELERLKLKPRPVGECPRCGERAHEIPYPHGEQPSCETGADCEQPGVACGNDEEDDLENTDEIILTREEAELAALYLEGNGSSSRDAEAEAVAGSIRAKL